MSVLHRPALLLVSATVAAGLLVAPGAARAAGTSTDLTAAEMRTALRAVGIASAAAGAGGWGAVTDFTMATGVGDPVVVHDVVAVDPGRGLFAETLTVSGLGTDHILAAAGRGIWSKAGPRQLTALRMMGKPGVTYVFDADRKLTLAQVVRDNAPDPSSLAGYYALPGTRTVDEDGTIEYKVVEQKEKLTVVMRTTAESVLTGVDMAFGDGSLDGGTTYEYKPQTITLPAAPVTLDEATVNKGVAYLDMAATVKATAREGAADTRRAAKGRTVKVATLRKLVRQDVTETNRYLGVGMVKVKNVSGGVRVYATNPWTGKSVTYQVKASGRKVLVGKL